MSNTKPYHRGGGEVVIPDREPPKYFNGKSLGSASTRNIEKVANYESYLASLPALPNVVCDPKESIGFLEGFEERYQRYNTHFTNDEWETVDFVKYDFASPENRRIFLSKPSSAAPFKNEFAEDLIDGAKGIALINYKGDEFREAFKKFVADQIIRRTHRDATDNIVAAVCRLLEHQKLNP